VETGSIYLCIPLLPWHGDTKGSNDYSLTFDQIRRRHNATATRAALRRDAGKKTERRLLLKHAASVLHHRLKLVSAIMSQASGSGAAASPQLPGLQLCDISNLKFDSATDPKEGGSGNTIRCTPRHAKLFIESALDLFKCKPHS
jgi:hypothetical protein